MKPIYETIDVGVNTSLKIATYVHDDICELANWHIHPEYELVYVKNGNGLLKIDKYTINYTDGILLFLGPSIPHADFGNKDNRDNLEVVIQFRKDFIEDKIGVFPEFKTIGKLVQETGKVLLFGKKVKEKLSCHFEDFQQRNNPQKLINLLAILEKLSKTRDYETVLDGASLSHFNSGDISRLEVIFEHVNEFYGHPISSAVLAKKVGLTTNSFCRFFKKMTNRSFIQFLNEFRTRKAQELFDENIRSVSEVMYKCGFNDPSYFTRQFKKHQHFTPKDYIQKNT
ncbi:MAG: AraC family transcriptional regulator [Bacteroidota bacterium]